jgi:hypothetical protein
VTAAGALTATNATITGAITASSGSFTGTVNLTGSGELVATNTVFDASGVNFEGNHGTTEPLAFTNSRGLTWNYAANAGIAHIEAFYHDTLGAGVLMLGTSSGGYVVSRDDFHVNGDADVSGGINVGTAVGAGAGEVRAAVTDSDTNTAPNLLILGHNTSATPVTNFGVGILMRAKSSTTNDQNIAQMTARWNSATHASRTGRLDMFVSDTALRLAVRMEASGSAAMIGFLGANAVVRQTLGAAATDAATNLALTNAIRTALINLGLGQT